MTPGSAVTLSAASSPGNAGSHVAVGDVRGHSRMRHPPRRQGLHHRERPSRGYRATEEGSSSCPDCRCAAQADRTLAHPRLWRTGPGARLRTCCGASVAIEAEPRECLRFRRDERSPAQRVLEAEHHGPGPMPLISGSLVLETGCKSQGLVSSMSSTHPQGAFRSSRSPSPNSPHRRRGGWKGRSLTGRCPANRDTPLRDDRYTADRCRSIRF